MKETRLTKQHSFIGPGDTLFLCGTSDVLLTTRDGGEAVIPWCDLIAFLRYLARYLQSSPTMVDEDDEKTPSPPVNLTPGG